MFFIKCSRYTLSLREKFPNEGFFSGLNSEKYGPENTPYLDTFYAVYDPEPVVYQTENKINKKLVSNRYKLKIHGVVTLWMLRFGYFLYRDTSFGGRSKRTFAQDFRVLTFIINRKNWRITIKLHFENLSIFFKKN